MSLLGIDIGTSGCKAATFSEDGHCLASSYREYPTIHVGAGRAELDSKLVWQAVQEVIIKVAAETKKDAVTALCVGSMGEAVTPVSKEVKFWAIVFFHLTRGVVDISKRLRKNMIKMPFIRSIPIF